MCRQIAMFEFSHEYLKPAMLMSLVSDAAPPVPAALELAIEAKPAIAPTPTAQILVLDDEKSLAALLGEMLGMLGYSPTVCHTPDQALELVNKHKYDLILSDFHMPGMDGGQFYRVVIERRPELAKRIIFLTGDLFNAETVE